MGCKGYSSFLFVLDFSLAKEKKGKGSLKGDKKERNDDGKTTANTNPRLTPPGGKEECCCQTCCGYMKRAYLTLRKLRGYEFLLEGCWFCREIIFRPLLSKEIDFGHGAIPCFSLLILNTFGALVTVPYGDQA